MALMSRRGVEQGAGTSDAMPEDLVQRWGQSSVAPFVWTPGVVNAMLLSGGRAVAGYVLRGRWAVTVGDVLGPPQLMRTAIDEYLDVVGRSGHRALFLRHPTRSPIGSEASTSSPSPTTPWSTWPRSGCPAPGWRVFATV